MMVKKTLKRQIKSDYFKDELFNSLPIFPTNSKEHISLEDNGLKINLPAICFFRVDSLLNKFEKEKNDVKNISSVFITGTYGKTSTAWKIASILKIKSKRVGSFIYSVNLDPHQIIRIENQGISIADFNRYLNKIKKTIGNEKFSKVSKMEIYFLIAVLFFAEKKPDILVFENYIGGLCDFIQRNMKCKIIVLTNIWTNHSDELSYANKKNIVRIKKDIALHKVGSIHNVESPCLITIDKDVHLENAIKIFSRVLKFEVIRTKNSFSGLIFETLKKLNISTTLEEVISLSRKISIPYRMEQIPCKKGKIILDSAYTKIKLQKVIRYLKNHFPDKKIIPFTCLIKDEHQKEFFDTMNKQFDKIILTYMNPKKFPDFSKDIFYTVNEINTYIKQQQKSNIFKLYLDPILAFKTEKSELKSNEILIIFGFPMLPKLISDEIGRNNKNVVSKKQLCYQKIKNRD